MTCATECVSFEFSTLSVINHRSDNGNFPGASRLAHAAVVADNCRGSVRPASRGICNELSLRMMARFPSFTAFTGFKPYNIKKPTSALSFNVNFSNIGVHKKGRRSIHVQDTPKYQFLLSRLGEKKKQRKEERTV